VHRLDADGSHAELSPEPFSLCLYRDARTHEVATLELTPVTARILAAMARGASPLADIVRAAAEAEAMPVDRAFVEALSTLLADLTERGVLLGSLAAKET
jgi:hypothetical protein